ncbi:MAG: N-6 DNA methylase [Candidatus Aminicenantes bacterium]|nr:N-6 DNA methylase [Candidatus Aminicenantes bacterium]
MRSLDYEDHYIALDNFEEEKLSTVQRRLSREVKDLEFGIDGIYFSGEFPTVYFKSITNFDKSEIDKICSIQQKIWNQRRVPFLYVSSPLELRIYNCFKKPVNPEDEGHAIESLELYKYSAKDDRDRLTELIHIFGRVSIESGSFWKKKEYANLMDTRQRVDRALIQSLKETRTELLNAGISLKIVHNLLIRSLFVLYLEDRKATTPEFYKKYHTQAESYFDILDHKNAAYRLYATLEDSFNGNLSPVTAEERQIVDESHLKIIKNCFWDCQKDQGRLFHWRAFDFSIIPIELISEIYEEFLKTEKGGKQTSKDGAYYTPHSLVEFILNEKLPWADKDNTDYKLKILDPTCGSGIFLVEAYRRLVDRWKFCNAGKKICVEDLKDILLHSIYGVEKEPEAIKVAAFSLYLAILDHLEPKSLWNSIRFPFLVSSLAETANAGQGRNLFCASSLADGEFLMQEYDLVVGNPPFKRGGLEEETQKYLKKLNFAQETVLAFLHRATRLSPNGQIAMVSASKILFNKSGGYQKFRNFLFKDAYVEAVYNFSILRKAKKEYGGQLFSGAVGPVCVIFYRMKKPSLVNERILYCAPKSPVKRNMVEGVVIDSSDFKFLPREECAREDSNIWKVAMWGTERDYEIINRLSREKSLKDYFDSNKNTWHYGTGLHKSDDGGCYVQEFSDFPLISTTKIEQFYMYADNLHKLGADAPYRSIDGRIFNPPIVIIKEGQKNKRLCASYIPFKCVYLNAVFGITAAEGNLKLVKALVACINSSFSSYFLFLTTSTWGIERERVKLYELLFLPGMIFSLSDPVIEILAAKVDEIISLKKNNPVLPKDTSGIEKEIDEILYKALGLSERERYLIEDTLNYSLGLFQDGEKSTAFHRPTIGELESYATILCEDINDLLQDSKTSVCATIYEVRHDSPLNLTALRFSKREKPGVIEKNSSQTEITMLLKEIDHYTYEKFSESVYFRKIVKYYHDDTIYIIKPNEKRFWSRSMAMSDADDIVIEVTKS